MLRRTFATFMKQWPGDVTATKMIVTCQPISLQDYPNQATGGIDDVINIMLGKLMFFSCIYKIYFGKF